MTNLDWYQELENFEWKFDEFWRRIWKEIEKRLKGERERERERERAGRMIGKEEKKNLKKHGSLEISRYKTQIDILHFWCQMARVQPFVVLFFFFLTIVINIIQILYI